jgi:hypothetical protein
MSLTIKIPRNATVSSTLTLSKNALMSHSKYKNVTISLTVIIMCYIVNLVHSNWHSLYKPTYNERLQFN